MNTNIEPAQITSIEDQAWAWIIKLDGDVPPTPADIEAFHQWMAAKPEHHKTFKRFSQHWDGLDSLDALAVPVEQKVVPLMGLRYLLLWLLAPFLLLIGLLQQGITAAIAYPQRLAAGGLAMALMLGVALVVNDWRIQSAGSATYITELGEQAQHRLPDGSILWLNTNSEVTVAYSDRQRLITLSRGEAHFEVESDKTRPFEVFAGTRFVRAVGTAFTVYLHSEQVEVTVSEGRVDLGVQYNQANELSVAETAIDKNNTQLIASTDVESTNTATPVSDTSTRSEVLGSLVAGQSVVIPPGPSGAMDNITQLEKQNLKRRLTWMEGQLIYAGESLEYVLKDVSRYTPVYIELTDPALKSIRIGGQFKVGETEALLRVLEVGFDLKVTRLSDHHVQIHAP